MKAKAAAVLSLLAVVLVVSGCSPEPGSEAWCDRMEKKSASEFSIEEGRIYAQACIETPSTPNW